MQQRMTDPIIVLTDAQRHVVETTIRQHCDFRRWTLHALNVRSNHVHVVVTADLVPEQVMRQFKAWGSRRLSEHAGLSPRSASEGKNGQKRWWTEHGSTKWINDEQYLFNAIRYVNERQ